MKMTKRILCLMLALAMSIALCACGGNKPDNDKQDGGETTTTTNAVGGNLEGENNYNDGMFSEW